MVFAPRAWVLHGAALWYWLQQDLHHCHKEGRLLSGTGGEQGAEKGGMCTIPGESHSCPGGHTTPALKTEAYGDEVSLSDSNPGLSPAKATSLSWALTQQLLLALSLWTLARSLSL